MKAFKEDSNSIYYQALDYYLGEKSTKSFIDTIPPWVYTLLLIGAGTILFLLAVSITSRIQVQRQTTELRNNESRHRALLENIPDLIFRMNGEGVFLDYHSPTENGLLVKPSEFLGKKGK